MGDVRFGRAVNLRGRRAGRGREAARFERATKPVVFVAIALYLGLAIMARQRAYFDWDLKLARMIQSISFPGFGAAMALLSELGSGYMAICLVAAAGAALLLMRHRLEAAICVAGVGAGSALNLLLKLIVGRPRPNRNLIAVTSQYEHSSFPSGHVVFAVELFGFLLFLAWALIGRRPARWVAAAAMAAAILLMGVSRVYVGAHWPSDVAGGYLSGMIWLALMIRAYLWLKERPY